MNGYSLSNFEITQTLEGLNSHTFHKEDRLGGGGVRPKDPRWEGQGNILEQHILHPYWLSIKL